MVMLSTAQVIGIVSFVVCVFGLIWTIEEGRISRYKEDAIRLHDRLVAPSEYETKLRFIEKEHEMQKAQLEREKQRAIEEGDKALEKEKTEKISRTIDWMVQYSKVASELAQYKEVEAKREALQFIIRESLKKLRDPLKDSLGRPQTLFEALKPEGSKHE